MTFMGALKTRVKLLAPHIVGDFKLPLFLYVALWGVFDFPPHISRTFVDRSERLFGSLDSYAVFVFPGKFGCQDIARGWVASKIYQPRQLHDFTCSCNILV
jgi:hypothetical protein